MILATVSLSAAMLCFQGACSPVLVGKDTPRGVFPLVQRFVSQPGYGGDVRQFKETRDSLFAVHRVWLGRPSEKRMERITGPVAGRRNITGGCINALDATYDALDSATHIEIKD